MGLCILAKISIIFMQSEFSIRPLRSSDNKPLAAVLREVLVEFGVPKVGTAYADPVLDMMFDGYSLPRHAYWVVVDKQQILGGGGIAPLNNETETICELQKMYFHVKARGKGLGQKLITQLLQLAKSFDYTTCYLETMPNMIDAQKLYEKHGFSYINAPMGNTGHYSCPVWMTKSLV